MALITLIFSQVGSSSLSCGILRFLIIFEKKSVYTYAVSSLSFVILSFIMTLLDKYGFTIFQSFLEPQIFGYVHVGFRSSLSYSFEKVENRHFSVFYN